MSSDWETAIGWARARSGGPQRVAASVAGAPGMRRLVEEDAAGVWLLPFLPEGAGPTVLAELGLPAITVEQPNDTARALAACLRCCWPEPAAPPWPGRPASWEQVTAVFRLITDNRDERVSNIALVAGVRRLAGSGWLRWSEATREVRLGPRVAAWTEPELSTLRELWRLIPVVERAAAVPVDSVPVDSVPVDSVPVDSVPVDNVGDNHPQAVGNPGDNSAESVEGTGDNSEELGDKREKPVSKTDPSVENFTPAVDEIPKIVDDEQQPPVDDEVEAGDGADG